MSSEDIPGSPPQRDPAKTHRVVNQVGHDDNQETQAGRPLSPVPSYTSMRTDKSLTTPPHMGAQGGRPHSGAPSVASMDPPYNFKSREEDLCHTCHQSAVKFCQTCSASYCQTHVKTHYTEPGLRNHLLTEVSDKQETLSHRQAHLGAMLPPPGEIRFLSVKAVSVTLAWGPPEGLEGPKKFKVTWQSEEEESSLMVKDLYVVEICDLQPGEEYEIKVKTMGDRGRQSPCVSAFVSTVIPPPTDLTIDGLGKTSVLLQWRKAGDIRHIPQRFLLSYNRPETTPKALITKDCSREITDLQPHTEYNISVCTVMKSGETSNPVSTTLYTNDELRILLVGVAGSDMDSTFYKIVNKDPSILFMNYMPEIKLREVVNQQQINVVRVPGFISANFTQHAVTKIHQSLSFLQSSHVFLVVIRIDTFTETEKAIVEMIQLLLGEDAVKYTMVLFTHGDVLQTSVQDFLDSSPGLKALLEKYDGRYHVFTSRWKEPSVAAQLLQKINKMVVKNGGSHYNQQMFQKAVIKCSHILTEREAERRQGIQEVEATGRRQGIQEEEATGRRQGIQEEDDTGRRQGIQEEDATGRRQGIQEEEATGRRQGIQEEEATGRHPGRQEMSSPSGPDRERKRRRIL